MPIEITVILGVLSLFGLIWAIIMCMVNADKVLDRLSDPPEDTGEKNRSGMKTIQEFRERMVTFKYMANDSKQVKLADDFLEWIDAIDNEFCDERTNLQSEIKALEESVKFWEKKYNEASVEAAKIRVDSDQKLREAQERGNEWKHKYLKVEKTKDPLYEGGLLFCDGRDADGKLQKYGYPIVTIQMPHDVYTEQKAKFESQAKELAEAKEQLEFARDVARFSGLKIYEVHGWQGDSLWKIYRYAQSEEALYEQLHRDGYYRIDYTQKIEG